MYLINQYVFRQPAFHAALKFPPAQEDAVLACLADQADIRPQPDHFPTGTPARMRLAHLDKVTNIDLGQHQKDYTRVL